MFEYLVLSYHTIGIYEILIIQESNGEVLTIKIDEYEQEQTEDPEYSRDGEIIH